MRPRVDLRLLPERVRRGVWWLCQAQLDDGSWPDFIVSGNEGREWTTAYVGLQLAELPAVHRDFCASASARAQRFIRASVRPSGGWGFAESTPVDADSTAWCLSFALTCRGAGAEDFTVERRQLRRHQDVCSGGFGTYLPEHFRGLPQESGYYAATPCVTAAAALALHCAGCVEDRMAIERAANYLERTSDEQGLWPSFWWDDRIYSTAMAVRLFLRLGRNCGALGLARSSLQMAQDSDGSWSDERLRRPNAFLTALALRVLIDLGVPETIASIRNGVAWLMQAQDDDGGWSAPPIMRIPPAERAFDLTTAGDVALVAGHRRTFVTATVLATLCRIITPISTLRSIVGNETPLCDSKFDLEVRGVIEQFDRRVTCYPPNLQNIARTTPVCRDRGAGLSHYLPFWLDDTLLSGTQRLAARQCALANRFGQVFCLLRDAILDESDDAERSVLLPADALFLDFIRCYQDLFPADHAFWNHFERSWHEYLDALAWEARHARRALPYEHRDVMRLGKKLSPLKICCAAMTLLADRRELLPALETLIEDLHIACQLVDDIRDWNEDLRLGHWSWALTLAREQLHGVSSPAAVEEALIEGGVALRVLDTAIDHLERARLTAHHLSLTAFEHWVAELHEVVRSARHAVAQRRLASHPFVVFREGNRCVALNTSTLGLFSIDQDLAAVLENTLQGSALDDSTTSMMDDVGLLEIGDPVAAEPSVVPLVYVTSRAILSYGDQALERGLKQLLLTYSFPTLRMVIRQDRNATLDVRTLTNIMVKGNEAATAVDKRISFSVIYDAANVDLNSAAAIGEVNGTIVLSQQPLRGDEDVRRICEVAKRIRETGCLKLELDAELEGYRGCVVDVLSQLETARFELISIQSNHATPAATQHEHAKLVELFATSLEEGHCIPIVSILQPLIALCRRKRHVTLCRGCCRDFILDVNGVHPRSMCSARRTEVAVVASGSKRNLADPSILGATAAKDSVLCRVCWARYLCDADCSDLDLIVAGKLCNPDQVICELRRERCARIVKLAARVEAHLPGLAQRWGGDDLRRGHN